MKIAYLLMWAVLAATPAGAAISAPLAGEKAPAPLAAGSMLQAGLGIVVDGRDPEEGLLVRALTPGGTAERLGVRVGDRLVAVNGQRIEGVRMTHAMLDSLAAAADGQVRLELLRDGQAVSLAGPAVEAGTAVSQGCGWVSTVGVPPRVTRKIFPAAITQINGRSTPLEEQNRYRVPAGRNVLVVQEFIDRHRIPTADVRRIQRMQARESARAYKVLVVDVEPGTRYSIGAELIEEGLTPEAIRENAFWQPVVWESRPEACR